jgi:Big-like domain-containing protein
VRKTKPSTLLLSGALVVAAAVTGGMLLTAGPAPINTGGRVHVAAPAEASQATATSTVLTTSSASPIPQGAPLMMTATVTPAAATGTVQFQDGSANIGDPVIVNNGKAMQTTSTLTVGSHQLSATFTPTDPARYATSLSPAVPFVIAGPTPTNVAVSTSAASPITQASALTLTATLNPSAATGMMQFKDGSTNIGDPVAVSNGTASTSTSTLSVGSHQLTAVFTPANPKLYASSVSPPVPFTVSGAAPTNTTLSASSTATPPVQGSPVVLAATVSPMAAAGTVQFRDGATNIGNAVAVTNGTASQTTSTLTVGSHQLTAVFTPTDATLYDSSPSSAVTFVISGATTTGTTLETAPTSPVVENTPITMTATITPAAAIGAVQFRDGNTNIGTPVTVNNGTARENATLGVGEHRLTAIFTPTNRALYSTSTSPGRTYVVQARPLLGAAAAVVPGGQAPPGDRGPRDPRPRNRNNPLAGLDHSAGTSVPIVGVSALMISRRQRKARTR